MPHNNAPRINETHLGYIQSTITRMGQNSFQAKTWAVTVISALIAFYLTQNDFSIKITTIIISMTVTVLFCFLDGYYLYLERGYRYLYNLVARIEIVTPPITDYDMKIPEQKRCLKEFFKGFVSISTGIFYGIILILLIVLLIINFIKGEVPNA